MKKGISLIVLVITIIVMIIIAGAIIISLNSTNVINKANTAVDVSNEAELKSAVALEYMNQYVAYWNAKENGTLTAQGGVDAPDAESVEEALEDLFVEINRNTTNYTYKVHGAKDATGVTGVYVIRTDLNGNTVQI